jgi:hypothetical protein
LNQIAATFKRPLFKLDKLKKSLAATMKLLIVAANDIKKKKNQMVIIDFLHQTYL